MGIAGRTNGGEVNMGARPVPVTLATIVVGLLTALTVIISVGIGWPPATEAAHIPGGAYSGSGISFTVSADGLQV